jgi:hypothetical protein
VEAVIVPDLRFGFAPLPEPFPGYDPAGDARALVLAGTPSPAREPIPGREIRGSFGPGQRYVVRIPDGWNGRLAVCGTPATRSEHANDAILGDALLAHGYAYAASNKGIPYNARVEPGRATTPEAYDVPFAFGNAPPGSLSMRFGALDGAGPIGAWHDDYVRLIEHATTLVEDVGGRKPERVYALGLSIGGGQVRYVLERRPELVDGGVEWAAVYWDRRHAFLRYLPAFLAAMPAYVASGFRDRGVHDEIVAAGFPPDRVRPDGPVRSLWDAHYSATPPFYADLTTFLFAGVLDPEIPAPATLEARARYVPSANAEAAIDSVAHTGRIGRPLVGIAGDADVFITPQHHFDPYLAAVVAAGCGDRYWQFEVAGGTHVDAFAGFGWSLQPQMPFAWRAFERLVDIVERGVRPSGAGTKRRVSTPDEI